MKHVLMKLPFNENVFESYISAEDSIRKI